MVRLNQLNPHLADQSGLEAQRYQNILRYLVDRLVLEGRLYLQYQLVLAVPEDLGNLEALYNQKNLMNRYTPIYPNTLNYHYSQKARNIRNIQILLKNQKKQYM